MKVTYIEHDGREHVVEVEAGRSVMEGAVRNSIPGIDGDCGGACACATCHDFIEPEWVDRVGGASAGEIDMLEFASDVRDNSRLGCQIRISATLDGLRLRMPESQA